MRKKCKYCSDFAAISQNDLTDHRFTLNERRALFSDELNKARPYLYPLIHYFSCFSRKKYIYISESVFGKVSSKIIVKTFILFSVSLNVSPITEQKLLKNK